MKNPTKTARGGEFPYSAPELEVLRVDVEQGFQGSDNWNKSLDSQLDWGYTNEADLF